MAVSRCVHEVVGGRGADAHLHYRVAGRLINLPHLADLPVLLTLVGLVNTDSVVPDVLNVAQRLKLPQSLEQVLGHFNEMEALILRVRRVL